MKIAFQTATLATAASLVAFPAQAQIVLPNAMAVYAQTFDGLSAAGTTNPWVNDNTLPGWSLFTFVGGAQSNYRASTGTDNTGAFYSYGTTAERALGSQASNGTGTMTIVLGVTNGSAVVFDSVTIGFDGEQWRNGGNAAAQSMSFEYAFGATLATATGWSTPGGFVWSSPVVGTTAGAVDGNAAGLVAGKGGTIATNWAPGETLWLRWVDLNNTGNDHGLAIDNFSLSVSAIPEPGTWALLLAGLAGVGFVARRRQQG
jgi:hypothetical protein